ncbi:MAG: hypothetical protein A2X13_04125 [Bacteroidetes bacterium GWC2_33_15]|nr:MAG: hypothetical protein A2X10_00890 [Bacteroidetes bacterium GWA2_33_15]OFX49708.1 MAG: hypothetical protein A2X13_04125 [Bacteroidetes bacterium GWC2_33_15]OFX65902.1 MAG: hypothetical protein A2X15_10710 [Bacteroidetes bacterium GWB2_32_14]OFX68337.1 MAG: hypothetical protein A2X14_08185 [Bacteroidetes bacterium GWD2_33_33]HAN18124.1 hypothetical protein [Bacteroidales bacterium]
MKLKIALILILFTCLALNLTAQKKIPELNTEIVKYVESVMGTKVERGECWDLANQALLKVDADWDREYKYGNKIDPEKDKIFPGDIVQFEKIKVKYAKGNATYTEIMEHHTAIVYKVIDKGVFELAHQNTEFSGRKVGISKFDISTVVQGKMFFYRPTKNLK